jgi:organic hydroperoxide reductase OsmC/OhrA
MVEAEPMKKEQTTRTIDFFAGVEWRGGLFGEIFAGEDRHSRGIACSPPVFGGLRGCLNPEEMLLSSLAQCKMATFLHFVNANKIELISYQNQVKGTLSKGKDGYCFTSFIIDVKVVVVKDFREKAMEALKLAERFCLVSNSLTGERQYKYKIIEKVKSA